MATRRTFITCALPYANGPIHLGHMVEHIQTDIYVRFLRSCGEDVTFVCADDTHGTPIELNAQKQGVTPEQFIATWDREHLRDFTGFDVKFDAWGSTNSPDNQRYAEDIYGKLKAAGTIKRRDVEAPYDPKAQRFLADRFIKGTCPNCKEPDQYGDACEKCGATFTPKELIDPRSVISGEAPVWKKSEHLFFDLKSREEWLKKKISDPGFMHPGLATQLGEFFKKGLADWDISRDGPYFGFAIPGETNKFFYVWLDAPIGYISTAEQVPGGAAQFWSRDSNARVIHCIGKDIVYFHCLFWPAVLDVAGYKVPDHVHIHGHLTVEGAKMSKSRGTFINARPYLELLDPSYLRFFYASLLGPGPEDLDLDLKQFRERVNGELVNNLGNLANRVLSILSREYGGELKAGKDALYTECFAKVPAIREAFEQWNFREAVKGILEIGTAANLFITRHEPWKLVKTDKARAQEVLTEAARVVLLIGTLLEPIVPRLAEKLSKQFGRPLFKFNELDRLELSGKIGEVAPLINRLEADVVAKLIQPTAPAAEAPKKVAAPAAEKKADAPAGPPAEIEYDDFAKVALKVGKVLAAEKVEKADKLLKLSVDLGEGEPRTIVAGIALAYTPEQLVGKNVVVVANLKPKPLKGIPSKGMLLAAGPGGKDLTLVDPGPLPPGTAVK
ncbi:MAG: methionine--tRNA ligase [Archangiaceae bacterium]|nr:methionine--tRNA ligase [Archangiaceae bacterium]